MRHRPAARTLPATLRLEGRPTDDPSRAQVAAAQASARQGLLGNPVPQNLTGGPADAFVGYTHSPQTIRPVAPFSALDPTIGSGITRLELPGRSGPPSP